jgi:hypothetical protein
MSGNKGKNSIRNKIIFDLVKFGVAWHVRAVYFGAGVARRSRLGDNRPVGCRHRNRLGFWDVCHRRASRLHSHFAVLAVRMAGSNRVCRRHRALDGRWRSARPLHQRGAGCHARPLNRSPCPKTNGGDSVRYHQREDDRANSAGTIFYFNPDVMRARRRLRRMHLDAAWIPAISSTRCSSGSPLRVRVQRQAHRGARSIPLRPPTAGRCTGIALHGAER